MPVRKIYTFRVSGRFAFPVDMLRYDSCWPADQGAVHDLMSALSANAKERANVVVELKSHFPPTVERWNSFSWGIVGNVREERA